ncbi:MAG TPA: winged helix DNA-binding domain-containing protein [Mycobacteriales bacterium]|nr:winged helix DNA-binding domain-containing protein [Mycobacteriales bacterium]
MILTRRALGRALLERQSLLRRERIPVGQMIEQLVGLQAQLPNPPYLGLWTRLAGFDPQQLSELMLERAVVRVVLMRGTIHLVTARDALALRPVVQPVLDRAVTANPTYRKHLSGLDRDELVTCARAAVEAEPLTGTQLRDALAAHFPDRDPAALGFAARCLIPMVQVPPRGLWGRSGQVVCTSAEAWLGRDLSPADPAAVIRRYLAAFGPASVADMQAWSGLTRLREVVQTLELRTFSTEEGGELFDLPDAPLPDPATTAPIRFLPPWDNALLSHADRTRIISDEHRTDRIGASLNGIVPGTILVDGIVRGSWKIERDKNAATLSIEPFERFSKRRVASIEAEGSRLLRFAAAGADPQIRFVPA